MGDGKYLLSFQDRTSPEFPRGAALHSGLDRAPGSVPPQPLCFLSLITGLTSIFLFRSELQCVGRGPRAKHGAHPAVHRSATA